MDFIQSNKDDVVEVRKLGVELICMVLHVAPSTYYAARYRAPSARALSDAVLSGELYSLWEKNRKVYGGRKLWKAAKRSGIDIGRDQTARLMRSLGMEGVKRSKRVKTTRPDGAQASRLGETGVLVNRAEPTLGDRVDVCADLGRCFIRVLHHRRLLQKHGRLAGRNTHENRNRPRRDRDGDVV